MNNPEAISSAVANLIELRKRLLYSLLGLILIALILLPFCNDIYQIIATPILQYLPKGSQLIAIDVISPFFVPVKFSLAVALFLSLPNTTYQLWQFLAPALYKQERAIIFGVIISSFVLFALGVLFCYYLVLPMLFHFITGFKMADIAMMTDIDNYLNFILKLFMIFGLAFETPIIVFLLVKFGIVNTTQIAKARKYVFVGCFIIAAIVTPPDVLSQASFALALYSLYELGLLICKIFLSKASE